MAAVSLVVFGALPLVMQGGEMLLLGPILCGFIAVFAVGCGYLASLLSDVLLASTRGEVHHPRWPLLSLGAIATSWLWWLAAWVPGILLASFPAFAFIEPKPEPALLDRLIFWEILALGGIYGLTAWVSVVLHEDPLAAAPHLVVPAIWRLGTRLIAPMVLLALIVAAVVLSHSGLTKVAKLGVVPLFGAAWVAWIVVLYLALVLARALGHGYRKRQKKIGWFATRRIRRELPVESTPTQSAPEI
jgi:hypothetical protein